MESRRLNEIDVAKDQARIRAQIALLQAQLLPDSEVNLNIATGPKEVIKSTVLVAGSPSPKKRKHDDAKSQSLRHPVSKVPSIRLAASSKTAPDTVAAPFQIPKPRPPSNMSAALSALHTNQIVKKTVTRSLSLTQKPVATGKGEDLSHPETPFDGVERDEDMQIVENLVIGPIEHKAPFDDPNFKNFEPYSRINLSSRLLPHDDLQEYMRGRYYLSPSLLYSVVRLSPNKQSYDVPIVGDWVTIAVIAERGQIQVSGGGGRNSTKKKEPSSGGHDDGTDDETPKTDETKKPEQRKKNSGKKYLSLRLVDFGHRSRRSSASSKEIIRGDALLNMLLFEADSFSTAGGDGRSERVYRGGSGGAFEACAKFREGTVIAIMNPKILKPFQRTGEKPHPTDNVLAITPESAQSIAMIGMSKDLGRCAVLKRDGKPCGSWCDKRVAEVCEYHVQNAVQTRRASRPEFSASTSGLGTSAARTPKTAAFDPERKWGLLPANGSNSTAGPSRSGGGATYIISGRVISNRPEYVNEKLGRSRAERQKRKREEEAGEAVLDKLLSRDGGRTVGAIAIEKAREARKGNTGPSKEAAGTKDVRKAAYPAEALKRIGFDPTLKAGDQGQIRDRDGKKRLDAILSLQTHRGEIELGSRPGKKIRSGVFVPPRESPNAKDIETDSDLEIELPRPEKTHSDTTVRLPKPDGMLVDSDDDLEIELPS